MTWREERRKDKAVEAEQRRLDAAAEADRQRDDAQQAFERKQQQQAQRRATLARWATTVRRWLAGHPVELLMSLIIVVPAVLAWSAMAAYGLQVYGPIGWMLPAFTEGGMWAFAFAAHAARREGRPTGWLQVGVWTFTAVAAAMNFTHGAEVSLAHGLVMATVAVGGVIAHQLITAAPMRTRRSREQRMAARRVAAMQAAAVRRAAGQLAADGTVELIHTPGTVTLGRRMLLAPWRRRLVPAVVPGRPVAPVVDELDAELAELIATDTTLGPEPAGTAKTPPETRIETGDADGSGTGEYAEEIAEVYRAIEAEELAPNPSRRDIQRHLQVRATTAQAVHRAVRGEGGPGPLGVAA